MFLCCVQHMNVYQCIHSINAFRFYFIPSCAAIAVLHIQPRSTSLWSVECWHSCVSLCSHSTHVHRWFSLSHNQRSKAQLYTHEHTDIKHMLFNVCARNIVFVVLPVPHYSCSWFVRCAFLFLTCMQLCVRRPQLINKL